MSSDFLKSTTKCLWTPAEDQELLEAVRVHGPRRWENIAKIFHNRTGKQCRERWRNHIDPSVNKGGWKSSEDRLIISLVERFGSRWSLISRHLPGRTDNAVKNRFNMFLRRGLAPKPEKRQLSPSEFAAAIAPNLMSSVATKQNPSGSPSSECVSCTSSSPIISPVYTPSQTVFHTSPVNVRPLCVSPANPAPSRHIAASSHISLPSSKDSSVQLPGVGSLVDSVHFIHNSNTAISLEDDLLWIRAQFASQMASLPSF